MKYLIPLVLFIWTSMYANARSKRVRSEKPTQTSDAVTRVLSSDQWVFRRWLGWKLIDWSCRFCAGWTIVAVSTRAAIMQSFDFLLW